MRLEIDDINANYLGLPEYPGLEAGAVILDGVSDLAIQMVPCISGLSIFEFVVTPERTGEGGLAEVRFSPQGYIKANFCRAGLKCESK